jgi:hypothetical protein
VSSSSNNPACSTASREPDLAGQAELEVARVAPRRELRIERYRRCVDRPAQRLEHAARQVGPPEHANAGARISRGIGAAASSGRESQRPVSAVRKTSFNAIASMLDAAYGRSFT